MKHLALLLLLPAVAYAQPAAQLPNIGKIVAQSDEYKASPAMQNGCPVRMCAGQKLCCVPTARVTLSRGDTTTVTDALVKSTSNIRCGCTVPNSDTADSCSTGGWWLAWIKTKTVADGTYTLEHAYAVGDEVVTCAIE